VSKGHMCLFEAVSSAAYVPLAGGAVFPDVDWSSTRASTIASAAGGTIASANCPLDRGPPFLYGTRYPSKASLKPRILRVGGPLSDQLCVPSSVMASRYSHTLARR